MMMLGAEVERRGGMDAWCLLGERLLRRLQRWRQSLYVWNKYGLSVLDLEVGSRTTWGVGSTTA